VHIFSVVELELLVQTQILANQSDAANGFDS